MYIKGFYFLKNVIALIRVYLYVGMYTYVQVLARGRQGTGTPVAGVIGSCELLIMEHGIWGNLNPKSNFGVNLKHGNSYLALE